MGSLKLSKMLFASSVHTLRSYSMFQGPNIAPLLHFLESMEDSAQLITTMSVCART